MTTPTPTSFELSTFINIPTFLPWLLPLPIIIFFILRHCEPVVKAKFALVGQLLEALSMPYLIAGLAVGTVLTVAHRENDYSWVGGLMIGWSIPGGLMLALGYLITRHSEYITLARPLSKLEAAGLINGPWIILIVIWINGEIALLFSGYDAIFVIFTPITFLIAYVLHRIFPRSISHILADLSIINAIYFVVIALTYWLWGAGASKTDFVATIKIGCIGLIIGTSIYQAAYLWSLTELPQGTIEVRTKNWHFLELVTVFFFFLFAPESINSIANRLGN